MGACYFAPTTIDDALGLMQSRDVAIVAGGTDYFPARMQAPQTRDILDVTRVQGLRGLTWRDDGSLRIGATTTWTDIIRADLPGAFDGLKAAAREVGGQQIQNAGTIAGNLCNASPAADGVPPLLTLDAWVELTGPAGTRSQPLSAFITGVRQTALGSGELLTALIIPPVPNGATSAFEKLGARRYLVISITMTAVVISLDAQGRVDLIRVAVGACAPVAQRLPLLETDMHGLRPDELIITDAHIAPLAPITDIRADAGYRLEAARAQIMRAIQGAVSLHV